MQNPGFLQWKCRFPTTGLPGLGLLILVSLASFPFHPYHAPENTLVSGPVITRSSGQHSALLFPGPSTILDTIPHFLPLETHSSKKETLTFLPPHSPSLLSLPCCCLLGSLVVNQRDTLGSVHFFSERRHIP